MSDSFTDRIQAITSQRFQTFIRENENTDVNRLLLSGTPEGIEAKEAAEQILSRRKAKDKLPEWYEQEGLILPPPLSLEQSSSHEAADHKNSILSKGSHIVDLTGGMGVDLLALSQNFSQATYVEMNPWLCQVFEHNAKKLSEKPIKIINQTAEDFLEAFTGKATFFIDPARRDDQKKKVFRFEDCSPNVVELLPQFKEKAEQVLIKAAPMIDITAGIQALGHVKAVHVVSIANECKEVLFLLDFNFVGEPEIHCGIKDSFRFRPSEEAAAKVNFSQPLKYLYDPSASIRKAGAFKLVATRYGLSKIAPNTHLYTSDELVSDFPGRTFEVLGLVNKKNVKTFFPDCKANVISKNHPLTADQLKKKLNLKDGSNHFLIGMRDTQEKALTVAAKRI